MFMTNPPKPTGMGMCRGGPPTPFEGSPEGRWPLTRDSSQCGKFWQREGVSSDVGETRTVSAAAIMAARGLCADSGEDPDREWIIPDWISDDMRSSYSRNGVPTQPAWKMFLSTAISALNAQPPKTEEPE